MAHILIVEDDNRLAFELEQALINQKHEPTIIKDFSNVITYITENHFDLIIMDINLPYYDGNLLTKMTRRISNVPIIITSARNSDIDIVFSMEMGSDDYLVKPFSISVLLAKVDAILRRTMIKNDSLSVKGLSLNENSMSLKYHDKYVELSKTEYRIMKILLLNPNKIVSRDDLLETIWDEKSFVDDNTLTVNLTRIKSKLADFGLNDIIKTKRGVGYLLEDKNICA